MKNFVGSIKKQLRCGLQNVVRGFHTVDRVLRPGGEHNQQRWIELKERDSHRGLAWIGKVAIVVGLVGPIYGIAMGSFGWVQGHRSFTTQTLQMFYSGIKIPFLIGLTVLIALPSFFVLNSLAGLRQDFWQSLKAVVSAQAGLVVILTSLTPFTFFFYVSNTADKAYSAAILFNAFMFTIASVSAQVLLAAWYEPLIQKNPRHRTIMKVWILIYAFVGIQMGYVLRPFIGDTGSPISLFRSNPFENAYVRVFSLVQDVFFNGVG